MEGELARVVWEWRVEVEREEMGTGHRGGWTGGLGWSRVGGADLEMAPSWGADLDGAQLGCRSASAELRWPSLGPSAVGLSPADLTRCPQLWRTQGAWVPKRDQKAAAEGREKSRPLGLSLSCRTETEAKRGPHCRTPTPSLPLGVPHHAPPSPSPSPPRRPPRVPHGRYQHPDACQRLPSSPSTASSDPNALFPLPFLVMLPLPH